jgi:hypothetical protein
VIQLTAPEIVGYQETIYFIRYLGCPEAGHLCFFTPPAGGESAVASLAAKSSQ